MGYGIAHSVHEYVRSMIERVPGLKVLILDSETTVIVSTVYSQSEILEKEIFLIEKIDSASFETNTEKMKHLNAVCFLRPVSDNFFRLTKELRRPRYGTYSLFFTNEVSETQLSRVARFDEFDSVKEVHEFYADCVVLSASLFSLNLPHTFSLTRDVLEWTSSEETKFQRTLDGLFSVVCAMKLFPVVIRYSGQSQLCCKLTEKLVERLLNRKSLASEIGSKKDNVLLILDRRDDPVTPLLNQWTYRAMIHELLGISNNRVELNRNEEIVMNPLQDEFYEQNLHSNFGDLGVVVKQYVDMYQEESRTKAKIDSIDDMRNFVDQYPEFRKLSGCVTKHVGVMHELSRLVNANRLLDISSVEQDLACHEQKEQQFQSVVERLKSPTVSSHEKLRLTLLFALRYEGDTSIPSLKNLLLNAGLDPSKISLVDTITSFAGAKNRSADLLQNKNLLSIAKNSITRGLKGTTNVYTQHKSFLHTLLEQLLKGKLKESQYPVLTVGPPTVNQEKSVQIVAFVVGGTTYKEAHDVDALAATSGASITLGGTFIHNTKSFLADLNQLNGNNVGKTNDFFR